MQDAGLGTYAERRELRTRAQLTIGEVARMLRVDPATIWHWERDRQPCAKNARDYWLLLERWRQLPFAEPRQRRRADQYVPFGRNSPWPPDPVACFSDYPGWRVMRIWLRQNAGIFNT